ncbi:MAG: ferrochelatase, partial [Acidimicrobiales bacterium]
MKTGVVVMAYGSPHSTADIEAYYTHIRHGRPPTAGQLADLRRRYDAIGGVSPLAQRTEAQRRRLALALAGLGDYVVVAGHKHAAPFIEDAVARLAAAHVKVVVGLVLAPHYSRGSVGEYVERLQGAAFDHRLGTAAIESWHDEPVWRAFQGTAVRDGLAALPPPVKVLFTAHSLPERVLAGDPYPDQLADSARA